MQKLVLDGMYCDLHITHTCNLACDGCSHYTNYKSKWFITLDEIDQWFEPWYRIIDIRAGFTVMGGEPTLHPQLPAILQKVRGYLPSTKLVLYTNGWFLNRHENLGRVLLDNDIKVKVSVHSHRDDYLEKLRPNLALGERWKKEGVDFALVQNGKLVDKWYRYHRGNGNDSLPFEDEDPRASWKTCILKAWQLYRGSWWKCPKVAYLHLMDEQFKLAPDWERYLKYKPLTPDATWEEKVAFFARGAESCCAMCPTKLVLMDKGNPMRHAAEMPAPSWS